MRIILFIGSFFCAISSFGAIYSSVSNGDWSNDAIWSSAPGDNDCTPTGNHTYNISHYVSSSCGTISFSGSVIINVNSGGTLYLSGSGGITGSVTLNIATGGIVIVIGNLNLSGSSDVTVNGTLNVNGDVVGVGSTFDCNGSTNAGVVNIGGVGCTNCTNPGDGGCTQNAPLPVNLTSFTAVGVSSEINVSWITTYEKDNDHFILERSKDGLEFEAIYNVAGKINTNSTSYYAYKDVDLSAGKYYYRLVQIDLDGTKTVTEVINASVGGTLQLFAAPNPGGISDVKINVSTELDVPVLIVLMDITGNLLYSQVHHLENNAEVLSIRELYSNLSPGIYYISASSNDLLVNRKIVVY